LLRVWQKLGPLFIMYRVLNVVNMYEIFLFSGLGAIIGGLGGINQSQVRVLLAYSSIGHIS